MKVVLASLICALPALGASYFVDYSAGTDSNAGGSTTVAFKHCPGDPNATGNAAATLLRPGDTVFFKGGVSYVLVSSGITVASGSPGNPVTYDGNSSGSWGTGLAILTDDNSANSIRAFSSSTNIQNVSFTAFKFTGIGGGKLPPDSGFAIAARPGYGITSPTVTNVLIAGCYFGQLGYYQHLAPVGNASLAGQGIGIGGCDGLTITNCEFTQIRDPLQIVGGNIFNATIANCRFHDQMEWAITVLHVTPANYRSNLVISGCSFTNTDQYYVATSANGQWTGHGEGPHQNAIMMFGAEGCNGNCALDRPIGDTNVFIHHNYFVSSLGFPGGSTCFWFQDGVSADIYDNVFNSASANNELSIGEPAPHTPFHVGIYNNTFYGGNPHLNITGVPASGFAWPCSCQGPCVIAENNLLSSLSVGNNNYFDFIVQCTVATFAAFTNSVLFDYNFYKSDQRDASSVVFGLWPQNSFYFRPTSSPAIFNWDKRSVAGEPLFLVARPTGGAANDFSLRPGSPAIGRGANLTALGLPGLDADFAGHPRPATGPWTIGAFEGPARLLRQRN